jgi:hypothetical protein
MCFFLNHFLYLFPFLPPSCSVSDLIYIIVISFKKIGQSPVYLLFLPRFPIVQFYISHLFLIPQLPSLDLKCSKKPFCI